MDFGSWTLVETVAWAKKAFGDDVSASFEGLRKCYDVHAMLCICTYACMYIHIIAHTLPCIFIIIHIRLHSILRAHMN